MESHYEYTKLFEKINSQIKFNKARLDCLTYLIISMLKNQTVNYSKLALGFPKELDVSSHLRRIQRFFPENDFSKLLSKMIPVKGKYKLSMDRTNWKFGSLNINLLYLSVIYDGVGVPILWSVLGDKRGNSNTKERKDLIERFIQLFDADKIEYLTADREFVGYHWWTFLLEKEIQFNIRFRQNFYVVLKNGKTVQAKHLLYQKGLQSLYCHRNFVKINGVEVYLSGLKYTKLGGK